MTMTTYHLLTEAEPFSEFHGGAISRWAGNALRHAAHAVVVSPAADDSWGFAADSIAVLPWLGTYKKLRRYLGRLPWSIHAWLIRLLFRRILRRVGAGDLVWIHNRPEFAVALTGLIRRRGGRVVLHLHNAHLAEGPERLMRKVSVDRLVFASSFLLRQAERRFPLLGASSVLYSGADESTFYPAAQINSGSESPTVLFAGRLVEEKGVHVLVEAMKLLQREGVRVQAQIVGSSNFGLAKESGYMRHLKADCPSSVTFLPYRTGAALGDLFRQADIFCSPAVWEEPFGLVNVEAMATGLPVVTTWGGGAREIFSSGGGVLVEPGSPIHLASALRELAEDQDYRSRLGRQGYAAFLKRFTWPQTRKAVEDIERSLHALAPEPLTGTHSTPIRHQDDDVYRASTRRGSC